MTAVTAGEPDDEGQRPAFHASPNIPLACLIAVKISHRLSFVYALARLAISMEILTVPTIELDPMHSPNIRKSLFPEDHIRMAMAIVSAYAIFPAIVFPLGSRRHAKQVLYQSVCAVALGAGKSLPVMRVVPEGL